MQLQLQPDEVEKFLQSKGWRDVKTIIAYLYEEEKEKLVDPLGTNEALSYKELDKASDAIRSRCQILRNLADKLEQDLDFFVNSVNNKEGE